MTIHIGGNFTGNFNTGNNVNQKCNDMKSLRISIEVVAGVVPGTAIADYTKQFHIPSDVWYQQGEYAGKEKEQECRKIIMETYGYAQEYMRSLWNPELVNWVRMDWLYY